MLAYIVDRVLREIQNGENYARGSLRDSGDEVHKFFADTDFQ